MLSETVVMRSKTVVARVVAGETLVVPVRGRVGDLASIYSFNGTGSLIWRLLESPKSIAELTSAVSAEYEVESQRVLADVIHFTDEMKAAGLIESSEFAPSHQTEDKQITLTR